MPFKSNSKVFIKRSLAIPQQLEKKLVLRIKSITLSAHSKLLAKTPVHEGLTVANWTATTGSPASGVTQNSASGATGSTNKLPLGSEPRRDSNEGIARASLRDLDFSKPFNKWFITNNAPAAAGLEAGKLPGKGFKSRSPNGMLKMTALEIESLVSSGAL